MKDFIETSFMDDANNVLLVVLSAKIIGKRWY